MAKTFVDRTIKAAIAKAKKTGKPQEIMEGGGFGFRAIPGGANSFILIKRYPGGSGNPTRRTLGWYPIMTLASAREKAAEWVEMIGRGIDPGAEEARLKAAQIAADKAKQAATFSAVFEVYARRRLARIRTGKVVEAEMRRELAAWFPRPIADITPRDVKALVQAIADEGHEAQAHQIFGYVRSFFNWVCDDGDHGIQDSPCAKLKPRVLIGPRVIGERVLSDAEIAAYWRAADAMGYPDGAFLKLLLLSAVRRTEAASMQHRELDLIDGAWTIPASRMKGGAAHLVPLVPMIRALIDTLPPRGRGGDYAFTNTGGLLPVRGFSLIKTRLDEIMRADLEAQGLEFEPFRLHDVRRTVRTRLSKLRVSGEVSEAILAHAKPGLHKVYNLDDQRDEKAEALDLWHAKLRTIVEPTPGNVVTLRPTG